MNEPYRKVTMPTVGFRRPEIRVFQTYFYRLNPWCSNLQVLKRYKSNVKKQLLNHTYLNQQLY